MSAPFRFSDIPDFSAPAPEMVRTAAANPAQLPNPTYILVLRDPATGEEVYDETRLGRSYGSVVADLDDAQVPFGFEVARVEYLDHAAGRIADATIRVIEEVARRHEARCEPEHFPTCLHAACDAYGIALPEIDDEGSVDDGLIRAVQRRDVFVADLVGKAA